MADFPVVLTEAVDGSTDVMAKHINNVEEKIGIDGSTDPNSLDYKVARKLDSANVSNDVSADAASTTKVPSVKTFKDYADSLVAGLLDYRGAYNASVNTFPASGGSGSAGAVMKGDMWIISVAGTLGGVAIQIGDSVIANTDTPGQTGSNWNILNSNISYVPEDVTNKVTSVSGASTDAQYVSAKLVYDQLLLKAGLRPSTSKTTLVDADEITGNDSANSFGQIKTTWTNVKSFLKTYFDTLYQAVLTSGTNIKTINGNSVLGSGDLVVSGSSTDGKSQTVGYLTGGTSPSALAVFQSLGNGANGGKVKINIDGNIFDNLAVDLKLPAASASTIYTQGAFITSGGGDMALNYSHTVVNKFVLTSVRLAVWSTGTPYQVKVVRGGVTIAISDSVSPGSTGGFDLAFSGANQVTCNVGDVLVFSNVVGTTNSRHDGSTLAFAFSGKVYTTVASTAEIATALQTSIRAVTGGLETVVYSTNKFVITSGKAGSQSKVLKLMTPSTGTDLSGLGTAYFDLAANATETLGTGSNDETSGKLLGGTFPSALAVFQSLANGSNNAAVKINIDGTVYDNLAVDLKVYGATPSTIYTNGSGSYGNQAALNHNWTATSSFRLASFCPYVWGIGTYTIEVRVSSVLVATSDACYAGSGGGTGVFTFSGANQIAIQSGTTYNFRLIGSNGRDDYAGQMNWYITGTPKLAVASITEIATALQTAIRAVTNKLETVAYSTNKYVLTSVTTGLSSKILKLMTPTTGTDISGAGATAYLDCAANAYEALGTGDSGSLVKLNTEGVNATPVKVNAQIGTTYTLKNTDAFKYVTFNNGSAIAVTIPTNATVPMPIGTEIYLIGVAAGKVTLSGSGVTINSLSSYKSITVSGGQATLIKTATDTWHLYGNLVA